MYSIELQTQTQGTTLDLQEIKTFLKVDYNDDDALINRLMFAAFDYFETMTGVVLYEKSYYIYNDNSDANYILPLYPITAISELKINDKMVASGDYDDYIKGSKKKFIVCAEGDKVEVKFTCGAAKFDNRYYNVITELIAYWYEHRENEKVSENLNAKILQYATP